MQMQLPQLRNSSPPAREEKVIAKNQDQVMTNSLVRREFLKTIGCGADALAETVDIYPTLAELKLLAQMKTPSRAVATRLQ